MTFAALLLAAFAAGPVLADVKAGVEAWSRGDYSAAVGEWQSLADAGDPDAMFNLAQAYRLGRGVAANLPRAEALYAKAAAAGHPQAADTYGLMLFQDGRREAALPYLQDAARRGDPRSQYLLGIAHFNGDLVPRDWVRAYALVSLANSDGLPQAAQALVQMDQHIPLAQRQQGAGLAQQLKREAEATRAREFAAAELGAAPAAAPVQAPRTVAVAAPRPSATTAVSPSVAAARAAVAEAARASGTESPSMAGASFARPAAVSRPAAVASSSPTTRPTQVARAEPAPARPSAPATRSAAAGAGPWRVQLGAFSVAGNAQRLWERLSARSELAGKERLMVPAGSVTKLQAGGYASRAAADAACRSLQRVGHACLVTRG
jgi:cell division septation protein DedD